MYYKRIRFFTFPVLPNKTVFFLGFFTSWIRIRHLSMRIRIQEVSSFGSGSETLF